jgi:hypothetical protein
MSFKLLSVADFDEFETVKLLSYKLRDVYKRFVFLFLELFEQCVAFAEEQVEY